MVQLNVKRSIKLLVQQYDCYHYCYLLSVNYILGLTQVMKQQFLL